MNSEHRTTQSDGDAPDPFEADLDGFPVASQHDPQRGRETLEMLASEFAERTRNGLQPSIEAYARRHPQLADAIRDFFPSVTVLEQWKLDKESECLRRNFPSELPLKKLGDCRLEKEIGRGGMGIVFEAVDERTNSRVAVKVLPWRFGAMIPRWRERFRKEAETVSRLRHHNIVPVYRVGEQDGYFFLVMQLVNGVSLDRVIGGLRQADGLPDTAVPQPNLQKGAWKDFAQIINQAASALCFAHMRGVLHNDVKPGNLLLDVNGCVMVSDFGLAKTAESTDENAGERLSGTLRYMAPERLHGYADVRSDVYSLGVTLYELATLQPAFQELDRQRLMDLIASSDYVPPREIDATIPKDLETMLLTAMAYDPEDRYQSVSEFASDLLAFMNRHRIRARRPNGFRRFLRECGRRWNTFRAKKT